MAAETKASARRGWYPDSSLPDVCRYWDGRSWADGREGPPPEAVDREHFVRALGRSLLDWLRYGFRDWLMNGGRPEDGQIDRKRARRLLGWGWVTVLVSPVWWVLVALGGFASSFGPQSYDGPSVGVTLVLVALAPTLAGVVMLVGSHRATHPRPIGDRP